MRLNIIPFVFFIFLAVDSLQVNIAFALPFQASQESQEQQIEKTLNVDSSSTEATESNTKAANAEISPTDTDATKEKTPKDDHQHQVVINPPVDIFQQQQQDIKHYLAQEKISPLVVGSNSYLIATNEYTTPVNKGIMVLIPDWQQSIATPNALNQLRKNMPSKGWTTITLHPPNKPQGYPSQALTAAERQTQDTETLASYSKDFAEIMLATIEQAKGYPGAIIVIAEGSNSAVLLDIYQQGLVGSPAAMVMLSSYMPTQPASEKLAQQMADTDYPILDLTLKRDHYLVHANATLRKDLAKKSMKIYFRQKQLSNQMIGYYPKGSLTKEIISWLSSMGW